MTLRFIFQAMSHLNPTSLPEKKVRGDIFGLQSSHEEVWADNKGSFTYLESEVFLDPTSGPQYLTSSVMRLFPPEQGPLYPDILTCYNKCALIPSP